MAIVQPAGVLFVELAGVSATTLRAAIARGEMPAVSGLRARDHRLVSWESDLTGDPAVSHAGFFHGDTFDLPASTWFDKITGTIAAIHAPVPGGLPARLEPRRPFHGGAWYGTEFDAPFSGSLARSPALLQTAPSPAEQGASNPFVTTAALRPREANDLGSAVADMVAGAPAIYLTLHGYALAVQDAEIGGEASQRALRTLDFTVGRLLAAAARSTRPYRMVLLSAHGLATARTFGAVFDETLLDFVYAAGDGELTVCDARRWTGCEDVVVVAHGGIARIWFPRLRRRLSREEIGEHFPGLLGRLLGHAGIGFALVNGLVAGGMVLGRRGSMQLDEQHSDGENPLDRYEPRLARHLRRENLFSNCPDILLASAPADNGDVAVSFTGEPFVAGALGGASARPFLLAPGEFGVGEGPLVGACALYDLFHRWSVEKLIA